MAAGDFVPLLSSMAASVTGSACIAGMMTRGGVPGAPLMPGHPLSTGLAERSLVAARGSGMSSVVPSDGATASSSAAHHVFNLGKLSAQFGVSEHGKLTNYVLFHKKALFYLL